MNYERETRDTGESGERTHITLPFFFSSFIIHHSELRRYSHSHFRRLTGGS